MPPSPPSRQERILAALAHASLLPSFLPFLHPLGPAFVLVVGLRSRTRSDWLTVHAFQALYYQVPVLLVLVFFLAPTPVTAVLYVAVNLYALYGAVRSFQGADFRYVLVGRAAERGHLRAQQRRQGGRGRP